VQSAVADLLAELHAASGCEKIGLASGESFAVVLCEVAGKISARGATHAETRTFLLTLRIEELALARACAAGNNSAWELFLTRYREKLYQSALRIAREDSAARDLADSLYAELYGTSTRDGERDFKFASFHRPRIARRLAAHRAGAGIRKSLSPHQTPRQPRRRKRRRVAVRRA
jgi:hypothetical protein